MLLEINIGLFFFSTFLLFCLRKYILLLFYFVFFIINFFINFSLKIFLQHPRPKDNNQLFHIHKKDFPFYQFGNPPQNIQSIIYTSFFISFSLKKYYFYFIYFSLSAFTIFIEIYREKHYIYQLIFSSFIGLFIASISYYLALKYLSQSIEHKEDDNAHIILSLV
jgi:hypothetical protein